MKRLLMSIFVCAIVLFGILGANSAQAQSIVPLPRFLLADAAPEAAKDLITQLETEVLPQLEAILTPEQRETFKTSVADGTSFRKAFKSLTLTPGQKSQLKTLLKSLPKQDAFASLTPDQKKKLFIKNKELFIPTPEEISEKASAGLKKKGDFAPTDTIADKINAALKKKEGFLPSPEKLLEKVNAGLKPTESTPDK